MIQISQEQLEKRWDEAPEEIRDAIFSDANNETLDKIGEQFKLDRKQEKDLAYICLVTFLGFISTKDTYNYLLEFFGGNAKSAYDVYVVLDEKLFKPVQGVMQEFRKTHWIPDPSFAEASVGKTGESATASIRNEEVVVPKMEEKINLKVTPTKESVNLKMEQIEKKESQAGPVIIGMSNSQLPINPSVGGLNPSIQKQPEVRLPQPEVKPQQPQTKAQPLQTPPVKLFSPHDFHMRNEERKISNVQYPISNQIQKEVQLPQPAQSITPPAPPVSRGEVTDQGPIILHKKEESIPVAQINRYKEYKNVSAGGFLGSFGNIFSRKREQQNQAPRARVEIPQPYTSDEIAAATSRNDGVTQNVPIKVKNFGDDQKTVQYSDYRTYLDKRDN